MLHRHNHSPAAASANVTSASFWRSREEVAERHHTVALNVNAPGSRAAPSGSRLIRHRAQTILAAPHSSTTLSASRLRSPDGFVVALGRQPIVPPLLARPAESQRPTCAPRRCVCPSCRRPRRHRRAGRQAAPGRAPAATPCCSRRRSPSRGSPFPPARSSLALRLENLELDPRRAPPSGLTNLVPQRTLAVGLLAEPERAHQRDLRTAVRRLATDGPGPKVGDGFRAVGSPAG